MHFFVQYTGLQKCFSFCQIHDFFVQYTGLQKCFSYCQNPKVHATTKGQLIVHW